MENQISLMSPETVQFRATTGKPHSIGTIEGYAARYYDPANPGTEYNMAGNHMRIMPGAFDEAMSKLPDVRFYVNHKMDDVPLGRLSSGTARISFDSQGMKYSLDVPDSPNGHNLAVAVQRGDIAGTSFTATITKGKSFQLHGQKRVVSLQSFDQLIEISPTDNPAFTATNGLRLVASLDNEWRAIAEKQLAVEKAKQIVAKKRA